MKVRIESFLREQGIPYEENRKGTHLILKACPSCGSSKKFGIDHRKGKFQCFKCASDPSLNMKGGLIRLGIVLGGLSVEEAKKVFYNRVNYREKSDSTNIRSSYFLKTILSKNRSEEFDESSNPIEIPDYFKEVSPEDKEAWSYLIKRGFTQSSIEESHIYVSKYQSSDEIKKATASDPNISSDDKKWMFAMIGRVIFMVFSRSRPYGYLARDYTGNKSSDYKVLNSKENFRSNRVWNIDSVKGSKSVVIAEGVFSAVKCGLNRSIATFGKLVSDNQISVIRSLSSSTENIYIAFDPDTEGIEAKILKSHLDPHFKKVVVVNLPNVLNYKNNLSVGDLAKISKALKIEISVKGNDLEISPSHLRTLKKICKLHPQKIKAFFGENVGSEIIAISKSSYKDPGDYSETEMSEFIDSSESVVELSRHQALLKSLANKRTSHKKKRVRKHSLIGRLRG